MKKSKHVKTSISIALVTCLFSLSVFAAPTKTNVKKVEFTDVGKLEISLSTKSDFKVFLLQNPDRLVIDIAKASFEKPDYKPTLPSYVSSFRSKQSDETLRMVFDLKQKITLNKVRFEKIKQQDAGNIIADISGVKITPNVGETKEDFISQKVEEFDVQTQKIVNPDGSAKYIVRKIPKSPITKGEKNVVQKMPVIVIDSGHGGKDPGTIGNYARTKEKNVTLSYAKELGKQLVLTKRYKVYLTRDSDNFIPLRQRVEKARKRKADLFISLHANSIGDSDVSGFSIYTLSERSSDRQAEMLAQKENRADIINGVDFAGASQDIMKTLIDLSQRESKNSSARFASMVIKSMKKSQVNILQNTHRFAGFAVLTAPDMASVLIELGYLSNKHEERLLNSIGYKRKIAESLVDAIDEYFAKNKS